MKKLLQLSGYIFLLITIGFLILDWGYQKTYIEPRKTLKFRAKVRSHTEMILESLEKYYISYQNTYPINVNELLKDVTPNKRLESALDDYCIPLERCISDLSKFKASEVKKIPGSVIYEALGNPPTHFNLYFLNRENKLIKISKKDK